MIDRHIELMILIKKIHILSTRWLHIFGLMALRYFRQIVGPRQKMQQSMFDGVCGGRWRGERGLARSLYDPMEAHRYR